MKNYIREGQKLPLFGIGPFLVAGMGAVALTGILLFDNLFQSGILDGIWSWIFYIIGGICIVLGFSVWYTGAFKSDMDNHITKNKLKTDGIYAWVRNPMYSGWLFLIFGVVLMWHNLWLLLVFLMDWVMMTIVLKCTEEKWLRQLYGEEYKAYCLKVNRCIPFHRAR